MPVDTDTDSDVEGVALPLRARGDMLPLPLPRPFPLGGSFPHSVRTWLRASGECSVADASGASRLGQPVSTELEAQGVVPSRCCSAQVCPGYN